MKSFSALDRVFVIAEAGSNWKCGDYSDDLEQAKKLIETAAKAGADAVKFQTYKPETIYVSDAGNSDYLEKYGIKENINEIFEHLSMPYEMIPELKKYCDEKNIQFMSTPFSVQDAKEVDKFTEIHKVASFEINHIRLLEFLAKTQKPIIVSTGASTFKEIDFAINLIRKNGNDNIALMQCTSKYPCPIDSLNLKTISTMGQKYKIPVGLSDHSLDPIIGPITAISLGAKFIEKHFTLDKNLPGPDHPFALNPDELELMITSIRNTEKALGTGIKEILPVEDELRKFAKRSIQAIQDIKKGDLLIEGQNFEILRPGNRLRGMDPLYLDTISGKKSKKDVQKGDGIIDVE